MRLPAELKLRVVELADVRDLKNLASTSCTMRKLWTDNEKAIWSVLLNERYPLESEVVGPAKDFHQCKKIKDGSESSSKFREISDRETVIEAAVGAMGRRGYCQWECATYLPVAEEKALRTSASRGGFGYLELLDGMSRCVEADHETLTGYLASVGIPRTRDFRSAVMLLWRMRWCTRKKSNNRLVLQGLNDDERIRMVAEASAETRKQLKALMEILAWELVKAFGVDEICCSAIVEERQLEEDDGQDRQLHQLGALLQVEMENWFMREIIERGSNFMVMQATQPPADRFGGVARDFCRKKIGFLKGSDLRGTISEEGVFFETQTDLVSRIRETWDEGKAE